MSNTPRSDSEQWVAMARLRDLETTILDAAPSELPRLYAKLEALITDLPDAIQSWADRRAEKLVVDARMAWLDEQISHVLFDIYPEDVFTKPTEADYKKANDFDANLHTRLHCDGIRHGLHILRREVRGLGARDDLAVLTATKEEEK